VGRAALDEDAIRMLEERHPGIEFDWTRILKGAEAPSAPERRPEGREPRRPDRPPRPAVAPPEPPAAPTGIPLSAAEARLGAEALGRLRGRYAEMLARISERVQDPERQAELKTTAERLNPDAWVTEQDVAAGLDGYEAAFDALRSVVGSRRRRRRRKPQAE
jgi:hypothetical protein